MVASRRVENLLIACDFDGTITERDTLHLIVERFGERGLWDTLGPRLRAGELTVEQAMQLEFDSVRATRDEVVGMLLAEAGLRPGFRELVDWSAARGHRLVVLSSGFRTVIEPLLAHWGFAGLDAGGQRRPVHPGGLHPRVDRARRALRAVRAALQAPRPARAHRVRAGGLRGRRHLRPVRGQDRRPRLRARRPRHATWRPRASPSCPSRTSSRCASASRPPPPWPPDALA